MEIVGVAANSNAEKLATAANKVRAKAVCLVDESKIDILRGALDYKPEIFAGDLTELDRGHLTAETEGQVVPSDAAVAPIQPIGQGPSGATQPGH